MKSVRFSLLVLMMAIFCLAGTSHASFIIVSDFGETGWMHATVSFGAGELQGGTITFAIRNLIDEDYSSVLLVDNVKVFCNATSHPVDHGSESFETGIWSGTGTGSAVQAASFPSNVVEDLVYTPTDGSSMAVLTASYDMTSPPSLFTFHGSAADYGTTTISFDWNFLAMDYAPYGDYAVAIITLADGTCTTIELARVSTVPIPGAVWFMGPGLVGLVGLRRRFFG